MVHQADDGCTGADSTSRPYHHVVLFVPGTVLGGGKPRQAPHVVERIVRGLEIQNPAEVEFEIEWDDPAVRDDVSGHVAAVRMASSSGGDTSVDFYSYDWSAAFVDRWRSQPRVVRFLRSVFALLHAPSFLAFFRTAGRKNPFGRTQLLLALGFVLVLLAYAFITGVALVQVVLATVDAWRDVDARSALPLSGLSAGLSVDLFGAGETAGDSAKSLTWQQWVALVGGAILVVFKDRRQQFASLGESIGATFMYLRLAEGQPQATAGLVDLVEEASKRHPGSTISIIAYSFGSLVAIDSLFPKSGDAPVVMEPVACLVTIGTPFDFVRAVQPDWTMGRSPGGTKLRSWVNIFSSIDLLGSNFRNTIGSEAELSVATPYGGSTSSIAVRQSTGTSDHSVPITKPTEGIRWDLGITPTALNLISFHGLSSHGKYWDDTEVPSTDVFQEVVTRVFEGAPLLQRPEPG